MSLTLIDRKRYCVGIFVVFLATSFSTTASANAQEDAYLKALESEAEELDASVVSTSTNTSTESTASDKNALSAREKEFSDKLKGMLPNTHLIYEKLTSTQKGLVVEAYFVNDKSMAEASKQIFNIYFNKK